MCVMGSLPSGASGVGRFAGRAMGVVSREPQRKGVQGEATSIQALREEVQELRRRLALQEGSRDPLADLHHLPFRVPPAFCKAYTF